MNKHTVFYFYDIIGYVQAFFNYFILFLFFIKPQKIKIPPFYFIFINTLLGVFFDTFSLVFHENEKLHLYLNFILPLYAVNNIVFIGLFVAYYTKNSLQLYFKIIIVILACISVGLYHFNGYKGWATVGIVFQSIVMISILLTGFKSLYVKVRIDNTQRSAIYIVLGLLLAFSLSFIINLLLQSIMDTSEVFSYLFYGIKNIFWIIANFMIAFAVYRLTLTSSPKPLRPPRVPN